MSCHPDFPELPIIICTGFSEKIDQAKAAQLGIQGLLMKPVIKAELARLIRDVLDKKDASTAQAADDQ